ncbi:MAG: 2-amino-4-hydroxy-6-hydroxymethyldihydropteridine diphosphokinase [Anaerolineae bacterium]|nr:2-amino-4-hydroxy-6-hydroxymethyldihydropteridine diphosphokinase [Anaerolineae bacterium]
MNRVLLSLGSNIDPESHLRAAVRLLAERCRLLAVSPVYETAPVGKTDQPPFLNAAAWVETPLTAAQLKVALADIEQQLGRQRGIDKNAARTIDLDITLFNEAVFDLAGRHIPDPELLQYAYIAVPAADLAPQQRHPETGQTLSKIAHRLAPGPDDIKPRPDIRLETEG